MNGVQQLSREATAVNQSFSQQVRRKVAASQNADLGHSLIDCHVLPKTSGFQPAAQGSPSSSHCREIRNASIQHAMAWGGPQGWRCFLWRLRLKFEIFPCAGSAGWQAVRLRRA